MTPDQILQALPWVVLTVVFVGMALILRGAIKGTLDVILQIVVLVLRGQVIPAPPPAVEPPQLPPPKPDLPPPPVLPPVVPPVTPPPSVVPPILTGPYAGAPLWFGLALNDLGFHETGDNRGIEQFIAQAHTGSLGDPWCAILVNAKLEQAGVRGSRSPSSQSFRTDANFVPLSGPALGAIVVFWRGSQSGGLGHVGFYVDETAGAIRTLGGNEQDQVQIMPLPKASSTFGLVGYWWPKAVPLPKIGAIPTPPGSLAHVTEPPSGPSTPPMVTGNTVTGKVSWFGGPQDMGVKPDEGVALYESVTGAPPGLFLPEQPIGTTGLARRLNSDGSHYLAMRWDYKQTPAAFLRNTRVTVAAKKTGRSFSDVMPADWGPGVMSRVADVSHKLLNDLGVETDDEVTVTIPSTSGMAPPKVS